MVSLHFLIGAESFLQLAQLVDASVVARLLQTAQFYLRTGAAQQRDGLVKPTGQRHAFGSRRQLLVAMTQCAFRLRQQVPTVAVIFIVKGVAVENGRGFRRLPALYVGIGQVQLQDRIGADLFGVFQAVNCVSGLFLPKIDIGGEIQILGILWVGAEQRLERFARLIVVIALHSQ